jgi:hypothetical protein
LSDAGTYNSSIAVNTAAMDDLIHTLIDNLLAGAHAVPAALLSVILYLAYDNLRISKEIETKDDKRVRICADFAKDREFVRTSLERMKNVFYEILGRL